MKKPGQTNAAPARELSSAELAAALENSLICIILLIAIGAALYILNGQIISLV